MVANPKFFMSRMDFTHPTTVMFLSAYFSGAANSDAISTCSMKAYLRFQYQYIWQPARGCLPYPTQPLAG